jgi:seryl-tRNA synthetase
MICRKLAEKWPRFDRKLLHLSKSLFWNVPQSAELDTQYLYDNKNIHEISENIALRKGVGNIQLVHDLKRKLEHVGIDDKLYETTKNELNSELLKIPNRTHPDVVHYGDKSKIVRRVGAKKEHETAPKEFQEIAKRLRLARTDQLGNFSGSKSYYFLGELAELEHALIRYVVAALIQNNFQLVSVPDILHRDIIEGCGMNTRGTRTQVSLHFPLVKSHSLDYRCTTWTKHCTVPICACRGHPKWLSRDSFRTKP